MNRFNTYVVGIAVIVLGLALITFGMMIKFEGKKKTSRVVQNTCPDGWNIDASNHCQIPTGKIWVGETWVGDLNGLLLDDMKNPNIQSHVKIIQSNNLNLTTTETKQKYSLDLTRGNEDWQKYYPADSFICARSKWANKNGLTWEGITNLGSDACV